MDDRTKAAFDGACENVKQLLALGTGSIGGVVVLFDDGDMPGVDFNGDWIVHLSLVLLAGSVLSGVLALGALVGELGSDRIQKPDTYASRIQWLAGAQLIFFGIGILSLVLAIAT